MAAIASLSNVERLLFSEGTDVDIRPEEYAAAQRAEADAGTAMEAVYWQIAGTPAKRLAEAAIKVRVLAAAYGSDLRSAVLPA